MNNPYAIWISAGTHVDFDNAISVALKKQKKGAVAAQIKDINKTINCSSLDTKGSMPKTIIFDAEATGNKDPALIEAA